MMKATAKLVDKTEVDKLVVEVTLRATVGELREVGRRVDELAKGAPIPWPLSEFVLTLKRVVTATVDRVESAQSVEA